ncbi:MAG: L-histidine N(alpha)-methyltransferase [Gemmatimonadota bacterium]|nr:MAG: L-histidine N(alpha)-methyltransferase [Gemmatimonadota bacterium]
MSASREPARLVGDSGVSFLVHHSMYDEANAHPKDVYGDLDQVVRTDLRYHYSGPICAHRWLEQCEDPAYGHLGLIAYLDEVFPSLIEALRRDSGRLPRIALTSLGPGDGSVDERMIKNLDAQVPLCSYCGLDFSFELLRRAANRIVHIDQLQHQFPVKMVCGDFSRSSVAALIDRPEGCVRLYTLTGLTLGNYNEGVLLEQVAGHMHDCDYLLVDARLHSLGNWPAGRVLTPSERSITLDSYDRPTARRFAFGPVEAATLATVDDVEIGYDVTRAVTVVPNALNILVYCTGLSTTMRLTGENVHRDRLDLGVTTLYHHPDLVTWLGSIGFRAVWHQSLDGMAMFLLRRA